MAKVLIKVNVAYPGVFIKMFEGQDRRNKGERGFTSTVVDDKPNFVYVILDWDSIGSAKSFWSSPEGKVHIAEWNSVIAPEITVLRESIED